MKTISTDKLKSLRKSSGGFLLIDVTSREAFDKDHIPGARSVPLGSEDFVEAVRQTASGSRTRKIVLYCAGPQCDASAKAARLLVDGGFTDVLDYEGGLSSWNENKNARTPLRSKS